MKPAKNILFYVLLVILNFLFLFGLFFILFHFFPYLKNYQKTIVLYSSFFEQFALILPLFILFGFHAKTFKELGCTKVDLRKLIIFPILTLLSVFIVFAAITYLKESLHLFIPGWSGTQENIFSRLGEDKFSQILIVILASISAPFVEELVFRGFLQSQLTKILPYSWIGILATAVIFSLAHMQLQVFLPLFILGIALGFLFQRTKSIFPGVVLHAMNNSLTIFALLYLQ